MLQKYTLTTLLGISALVISALTSQAQQLVYNSVDQSAIAGYSELNTANPIFGDALNLSAGGHLSFLGLTLFNSSSGGNTGSILTGSMVVKFYDNTVPYAGGSLGTADPLIATATLTWDFTSGGGLPSGFFSVGSFDLTSLNITLPQHIFITQQFTELTGTSTRNGVVLFGDATIGSSPNNVYINSTGTAEGLYTFGGAAANSQFGYHVEVVPEPSALAFAGLAGATALIVRRRKTA
jgi:hypothetical protein